jgi:hypothetical protein
MSELLKLTAGDEPEHPAQSEEPVAANQNRREWVFTTDTEER